MTESVLREEMRASDATQKRATQCRPLEEEEEKSPKALPNLGSKEASCFPRRDRGEVSLRPPCFHLTIPF